MGVCVCSNLSLRPFASWECRQKQRARVDRSPFRSPPFRERQLIFQSFSSNLWRGATPTAMRVGKENHVPKTMQTMQNPTPSPCIYCSLFRYFVILTLYLWGCNYGISRLFTHLKQSHNCNRLRDISVICQKITKRYIYYDNRTAPDI